MASDKKYYTIVGDGSVLWGTASSASYSGYVQGVNEGIGSERSQARDSAGTTIADCLWDPFAEGGVDIILNSATPDPEVGDTAVSITDGITTTGHVVRAEFRSSNTEFKRWRITIMAYKGISGEVVPANSISTGS